MKIYLTVDQTPKAFAIKNKFSISFSGWGGGGEGHRYQNDGDVALD